MKKTISICFLIFEAIFILWGLICDDYGGFLWFLIPFQILIYIFVLLIADSIQKISRYRTNNIIKKPPGTISKKPKIRVILSIIRGILSAVFVICFVVIVLYSTVDLPDILSPISLISGFGALLTLLVEFIIYITSKIKDKRNLNN